MDTDDIDDIDVFLSVIDTLIENHSQKIICCVDDPIWKEQRLIPNLMYYSPRLQQLILNNQEFEPTFYDDLFFFLVKTYVRVTDHTPPPWFTKNLTWLKILNNELSNYENNYTNALSSLLYKCTSFCADKIIHDATDLIRFPEYEILKSRKKQGHQ